MARDETVSLPTGPEGVAPRLAAVRERIADACRRAGRDPAAVTLVAVTKRIPLPSVVAACRAGQWELGENRVQDALPRQAELAAALAAAGLPADRVRWHFIGNIQTNKTRKVVGRFTLLQAVDSLRLARRLDAVAAERELRQPVLLEVNISGEPQKHGLPPEEAVPAAAAVAALGGLELRGLMGMARFGAPEAELRRSFALLRELRGAARRETGLPLPVLSMGMSGDYPVAVEEGATMVRVGTAIFGPRPAPPGGTA